MFLLFLEFLTIFDNFWTFAQFSQQMPVRFGWNSYHRFSWAAGAKFMPVTLLGGWELSLKIEFVANFDDFRTCIHFSQKRPIILPNAELMPTPTLFESWPARAAMLFPS